MEIREPEPPVRWTQMASLCEKGIHIVNVLF
jgi:hypothetical protein